MTRVCGTQWQATDAPLAKGVQYILGWPVPQPTIGSEYSMRNGEAEYGRLFDDWVRHIVVAVKTERSVTYFPACACHPPRRSCDARAL